VNFNSPAQKLAQLDLQTRQFYQPDAGIRFKFGKNINVAFRPQPPCKG
jgi:hypothetical protein